MRWGVLDELMAADGVSWEDLSFVADSLRSVMGPEALLYENDAFHQGLLDMPHVPSSLNWFSADGCYGWSCPFDGPTGLRTAYEQHILPKLAHNQSAFVVPGTYECDSATTWRLQYTVDGVACPATHRTTNSLPLRSTSSVRGQKRSHGLQVCVRGTSTTDAWLVGPTTSADARHPKVHVRLSATLEHQRFGRQAR